MKYLNDAVPIELLQASAEVEADTREEASFRDTEAAQGLKAPRVAGERLAGRHQPLADHDAGPHPRIEAIEHAIAGNERSTRRMLPQAKFFPASTDLTHAEPEAVRQRCARLRKRR